MPMASGIESAHRMSAVAGMAAYVKDLDSSILKPAQQAVMHDVLDYFTESERGYIAMPTGSGKTVLMSQIIRATELPTLIVVPTKQLVEQTIAELQDKGVSSVRQAKNKLMLPAAERGASALVEVTTYAAFARSNSTPWGKNTINPQNYQMVILDEAHHAMAYGANIALKQFGHAYQLGFTATPDYSAARRLVEHLPSVVHELTIKEAVDMNLITSFVNVLLTTDTDISHVKRNARDYDVVQLDKAINTDARNAAVADFYAAELADKKAVFSCNSVEHAAAVAVALRERGIAAASVYGGMPKQEFEAIMAGFKQGKIKALTNNKLLTEGFNDTSVEVIVNVSPTLSRVRQLQRSGRGLRTDANMPNKELLVVDCIDTGHKVRPALFFDESVAGTTGIATARPETKALLERLAAYESETARLLTSDEEIYGRVEGLIYRAPSYSGDKPRSPRSSQQKKREHLSYEDQMAPLDSVIGIRGASGSGSWVEDALCAETDPEAFYPEKGGSTREAKRICLTCGVRNECLEWALENQERFGIWGGLSERERRKLLKQHAAAKELEVAHQDDEVLSLDQELQVFQQDSGLLEPAS